MTCGRVCLVLAAPSAEPILHLLAGEVQARLAPVSPCLFPAAEEGVAGLLAVDIPSDGLAHQPVRGASSAGGKALQALADIGVE